MFASTPTPRTLIHCAAAAILALSLALPGRALAAGDEGKTETREIHVDHADQKPLRVKSENGGISVTPTAAGAKQDVSITAKVRAQTAERLKATAVVAKRLPDGTLDIHVQWPDAKRRDNEGCSFEITLPNVRDVGLASSNGGLTLSGAAGPIALDTSNGGIGVRQCTGVIHADTSNGGISIDGAGGQIVAHTTNGAVTIADAAGPVDAGTSNGPIDIALRSSSTGPVRADTKNGPITLVVGPAFTGTVAAGTSNAGVGVEVASTAQVTRGKGSAKVRFSASGPDSTLETANGPIKIKQARSAD